METASAWARPRGWPHAAGQLVAAGRAPAAPSPLSDFSSQAIDAASTMYSPATLQAHSISTYLSGPPAASPISSPHSVLAPSTTRPLALSSGPRGRSAADLVRGGILFFTGGRGRAGAGLSPLSAAAAPPRSAGFDPCPSRAGEADGGASLRARAKAAGLEGGAVFFGDTRYCSVASDSRSSRRPVAPSPADPRSRRGGYVASDRVGGGVVSGLWVRECEEEQCDFGGGRHILFSLGRRTSHGRSRSPSPTFRLGSRQDLLFVSGVPIRWGEPD